MSEFFALVTFVGDHYSAHMIIVMVTIAFAFVIRKLYRDIDRKFDEQLKDCREERKECKKDLGSLRKEFDAYLIGAARGRDLERRSAEALMPAVRMRQSGPVADLKTTQRLG